MKRRNDGGGRSASGGSERESVNPRTYAFFGKEGTGYRARYMLNFSLFLLLLLHDAFHSYISSDTMHFHHHPSLSTPVPIICCYHHNVSSLHHHIQYTQL